MKALSPLVDQPYAIDDEGIDDVVLRCNHVILSEPYSGGEDSGILLDAVDLIVKELVEKKDLA